MTDTLPQWIMAILAVFATGVSIYGIILIRATLYETEKVSLQTERSVASFEKALMVQSRAYVGVGETEVTFDKDSGEFRLFLAIRNRGTTPALRMSVRSSCRTSPFPSSDYVMLPRETTGHSFDLGPDEKFDLSFYGRVNFRHESVPTNQGIVISALVRYYDVFGCKRSTLYSGYTTWERMMQGDVKLQASSKHNRSV